MIRQSFLIFLVMVTAGLGPAMAQSYYLKPQGGSATQEQSTAIYNKAVPNTFAEQQPGVKYKDKLATKTMKIEALSQAKGLAAWQASGMKPQNEAEIMAVARAHRAVSESLMLERREQLIKVLERNRNKRAAEAEKVASSSKPQGLIDLQSEKPAAGQTSGEAPDKQTPGTSQYYLKPGQGQPAATTKVYTKYN